MKPFSRRNRTGSLLKKSCLSALVSIAIALGASANAQQPPESAEYAVPAGDLISVVNQISRGSGVQIVYDIELLRGKRSAEIIGSMSLTEALERALRGSGLSWKQVNASTISIQKARQPKSGSTRGGHPSSRQQTEESEGEGRVVELEQMTVVGSRIGSTPSESALPIKIITRDEIERSGASSIAQMLSYLPEVSVNGDQSGSIGSAGTGLGLEGREINASTVQLRGLPLGTTLVLINGRRSGESSALMQSGQFDLSTIPLAMVERIEVLPAGASAVYGGDGMAGVVNIVLRRDTNGIGLRVRHAQADGYTDQQASLVFGKSWSRGSMTGTLMMQKGDGLESAQRGLLANADFSRFGGSDRTSLYTVYPGNVFSLDGCQPAPALCFIPLDQRGNLPGLDSPFATVPTGQDGRSLTLSDFLATAGQLNRASRRVQLISPETNKALTFNGHFELTPSTELIGELMYNRRSIPARQLVFSTGLGEYGFQTAVVGADNPFNPFGVPVGVNYWYEDTNIYREFSQTFWRAMVGARGKVKDWQWEATVWRSRDTSSTGNVYSFVSNRFPQVLNTSDPSRAVNLFSGDGSAPASLEVLRSLMSLTETDFGAEVTGVNAFAHGPLLALPAGDLQALFGIEYQKQALISNVQFYDAGELVPVEAEHGPNYAKAMFTELRAPILAAQDGSSGKLTATGAFRVEDTGRMAERASTETLGLEFRPFPGLLLRGMHSTAFKPLPIYSAIQSTHLEPARQTVTDPTLGGASFPVSTIYGGGLPPGLRPEISQTQSFGLVLDASNSRISASFWKTHLDDLLSSASSPQFFLDNEDELPGRVIRDPTSGVPVTVDMRRFNVNNVDMNGVDVTAEGRWETAGNGDFSLAVSATYTHKYEQQLTSNASVQNHLGVIRNGGWAPRWKIVPRVEWFHRDTSVSVLGRYVSSYEDPKPLVTGPRAGQKQQLGDFWMFDINADLPLGRYLGLDSRSEFLGGVRFSLGARNVFNRLPDFCNYCFLGYDASQYDIVGRTVYAEVRFGF